MRGQRTVLAVDDEPKILEVVASFLESKGFAVLTARDGQEALALFDAQPVSLVLLDLMLPGLSGEEVCRAIRRKSRVPVIMLTAKMEEADLLQGLSIGADDYVTKPFSLATLYARMEAVLRRSGEVLPLARQGLWNGGDLTLDAESRTVKKRQMPVSLTAREYAILAALSAYPNKVFTREELIALALDEHFDGFDRSVDFHIKNLRQKIEDDPKNPVYIRTVHGVGYKFSGA